jgi:hypothetical protein
VFNEQLQWGEGGYGKLSIEEFEVPRAAMVNADNIGEVDQASRSDGHFGHMAKAKPEKRDGCENGPP